MVNPVTQAKTMWADANESVRAFKNGEILHGLVSTAHTALDALYFVPVGSVAANGVRFAAKGVSAAGSRLGFFGGKGGSTTERSIAASHIRDARALLIEAGLPVEARNEIIKSFELDTFRVTRTMEERTAFRVFDDSSATLKGRYVTENVLTNQTSRITKLALPNNSATRLGEVTIPVGSIIFEGKIAPQIKFSPALLGGEKQLFLTGNLEKYSYQEVLMPRYAYKQATW